jgi:hypothetical protein
MTNLAAGTTQTTLAVTTNENATCAQSTNANATFAQMTPFTTTGATSHSTTLSPLSNGTTYTYYVKCKDTAGNISGNASVTFAVANPVDTTPPSVPTNLVATAQSSSAISLSWTASTDNVGVTGYDIYRNGTQVGTAATNSYSDTGLTASIAYTYTVSAYDAAGNNSAQSSSASATTQSGVVSAGLFPAMGDQTSSVYPWAQYPPGVTYNGGIPARPTQCGPTLFPLGNGQSDVPQIQAAVNACAAGDHVQLGAGIFLIGNGSDNESVNITNSNITLRGMGPGPGSILPGDYITGGVTSANISTYSAAVVAAGATVLFKNGWDNPAAQPYGILYVNQYANSTNNLGPSINLGSDGKQGATSITLASAPSGTGWAVGDLVLIDIQTVQLDGVTAIDPDAYWGPAFVAAGSGSYGWYSRPYRSINQIVKITGINGNVVTIESPLSIAFPVAYQAQLSPYTTPTVKDIGIENVYLYGGSGGHGNIWVSLCDSCWISHIESQWQLGDGVGFYGTYRSELRDSYIHESQSPIQGGGGYEIDLSQGASNNPIENNISWNGNKVDVMRAAGGGNVIAYNYMDDPWNWQDPVQAEAGVNAGHFTGSNFELIEGNWSHKYSGDSWWGNSIYITAFRNWFTGLRSANGPLKTYTVNNGGTIYPYGDYWTRSAVDIESFNYYTNLVGNVLGFNNMPLFSGPITSNFSASQADFKYEDIDGTAENNTDVPMYVIGSGQDNGPPYTSTLYQQTNRQGNFDVGKYSGIIFLWEKAGPTQPFNGLRIG